MGRNTTAQTEARTDETVIADYVSADRSGRARFRNETQRQIMDAARALDVTEAARLAGLLDAATAAAAEAAGATVEVDWSALIAERVAVLRRAADMLAERVVSPEGMPEDSTVTAEDVTASLDARTDSDDDATGETALTLARRRIRRGGVQRDVTAWLQTRVPEVMTEGEPVTVADLRRGADDAPTSGSIAQALNAQIAGDRDLGPVVGVPADGTHPLRASLA